ncbi:ATP-binding cassette domain-containing protein [Candidatus Peregrinibacteria bacterium]|nr:ATP-binding cassette domain-containing protein [Candidatus Peregrinibacteria bacterium]
MNIFLRTLGFFREKKWWVTSLVFVAFFQASLSLVEPIFFREIIDTLTNSSKNEETLEALSQVLFLWILVAIFAMTAQVILTYFTDVLVHKLHVKIWKEAIERVLSLSLRFHNSKKVGSTMRRIERGSDNIFETQLDFLREDLPRIFTLLCILPLLFWLHFQMAVLLSIILPVILTLAIWGSVKTNQRQDEIEKYWTKASGVSWDAVANISVIQSFTAFGRKMREITALIWEAHTKQLKVLKWWCFIIVLGKAASFLATISVFALGGMLFLKNEITIGEIVMFSGYSLLVVNHVESSLWHFQRFLWRKYKLQQFFEIWDEVPDIMDAPNAQKMPVVRGEIEFQNVSFSHDNQSEALKNVSFSIPPGQTVALVGHTGSGKTTTVNLLSRFFDIDSGKIFIDGTNISTVTQESLRKNIGMVFQENYLFHESIYENLQIGNPKATKNEIEASCRAAHVWEFISELPKGIDTVVGERGVKLSGGEKQRVAIARALLKNPPILVLDEATSALDAETEQRIQEALEKLIKNRTTLIIAHRLSTIKKADMILVFEKGKIVERGTYASLMHKKGNFSRLVEAQVSGFVM